VGRRCVEVDHEGHLYHVVRNGAGLIENPFHDLET
jgi:hypothetical protein